MLETVLFLAGFSVFVAFVYALGEEDEREREEIERNAHGPHGYIPSSVHIVLGKQLSATDAESLRKHLADCHSAHPRRVMELGQPLEVVRISRWRMWWIRLRYRLLRWQPEERSA